MLDSLIAKARRTTIRWWKWILGVIIVVLAAVILWKLRKQKNEIARLEAELTAEKELLKDLETRANAEKDLTVAAQLRDEAAKLTMSVQEREKALAKRAQEIFEAIKRAEAARNWEELEAQARGDKS